MNTENYVPKNLDDAIDHLTENMDDESREQIKKSPDMHNFHFTAGMAMRNSWGLWSGSPLKTWFLDQGIWHADDMSGVIMEALWCKIHEQPFDITEKAQHYKEYWAKSGLGFDGEKI